MNSDTLNKKLFEKLLEQSRYQFILKSKDCIFFVNSSGEITYTDTSFVAHNETKKCVEIVDYDSIIEITSDGKKYYFKK